jgi:Tfp pilus assembly protein PilE
MRKQQRGITFIGMVFVGVIVAVIGLITAQVVPTYLEFQTIQRAAQRAAESGTTVAEIRAAFDRTKQVEYFTAISGRDLEISKVNDRVIVEFAYAKEIHLVGPAYLLLKYQGRTR